MSVLRRHPHAAHRLRQAALAVLAAGALGLLWWMARPADARAALAAAVATPAVVLGICTLVLVPPVPVWLRPKPAFEPLAERMDRWNERLARFSRRRPSLCRRLRVVGLVLILVGAAVAAVAGVQAVKHASWSAGWKRWATKPEQCPEPLSTIQEGIRYNAEKAEQWAIPTAIGLVVLVAGAAPLVMLHKPATP